MEFVFKQFDVVKEVSDHHFTNDKSRKKQKKSFSYNGKYPQFYTKIMREWKILEKNLPESIYVQVYETSIDLIRAAIIGPPGTPYHDGLYFFDIFLPMEYPEMPPKVHYHSYGYNLNPNLYSRGFVCLSLINTWRGDNVEKWRKNQSTLLQLLVSIQGLVLNDKPYFNEPGREVGISSDDPKWIKRCQSYNESVFVLACRTMARTLRKPPENFEAIVAQHFRDRGECILAAVKAYRRGRCPIGQFHESECGREGGLRSVRPVSEGFKYKLKIAEKELKDSLRRLKVHPGWECRSASRAGKATARKKRYWVLSWVCFLFRENK
ncbi:putative ubiquitin-conjugating enzyme E2 39 [Andrographis paniculata]|uniref:putative ubiquitin-conjugating enzyme E2 39 n=1 Tax=Andrographis paniculata TaxID=175694 RepID=UPI0021E92E3A|nr:putative ubiquitin-conjugating enzyme E2 39 [Andrographis paniculata]